MHQGYSPDRVVADPDLNAQFLDTCRQMGLQEEPRTLNRILVNARKASHLKGVKTTRATSFRDEQDYRFASEIAARFLERRHKVTLDDIVCDPALALELDEAAAQICPGFSSLQYRWAALNLRKAKRLRPERVSHAVSSEQVQLGRAAEIDPSQIPCSPGLYIFYTSNCTLYVGESGNLRKRIEKHLEHSDNKGLARWLWERGQEDILVELHVLALGIGTRERRALEAELIESRRPIFNVQRRQQR